MPIAVHTIEVGDGSNLSAPDRVKMWRLTGIANASGGSGVAVTTAVSVSPLELPASYSVFIDAGQECMAWVTSKTAAGFNVVLQEPGVSIASGTFDVLIIA